MSRFDQRYLGSGGFPQALTGPEIERFFTPTPEEKLVILQRRSVPNRIAFALQIGFLKMTGRSLNSVELAPSAVLSHIGVVIGCTPPRIASIRALYRRRRTLFDHQSQARQLLGRREISDHGMRGLTGYLRREAISVYDVADLSDRARVWLVDHGYLLPRERQIRRMVVRSLRHQESQATSRSKPGRATVPLAERPRSSSMTSMSENPRWRAISTRSYWRRWLSRFAMTWDCDDWRT